MSSATSVGAASHRCRKVYDKVMRHAERLEELAAQPDDRLFRRAERVSAWSVADHLDHLAKANQAMAGAIRKALESDDSSAGGGPTLIGRAVLLSGWIPRGAGKAPSSTVPQASSSDELRRELRESRCALGELAALLAEIETSRGRANHFAFGDLTPFQWLNAIDIHTRHHLKIIRAIHRALVAS